MSHNRTHHTALARRLHAATEMGYQKALQQVQAAASANRLPARLDEAGMATALAGLTAAHTTAAPTAVSEPENLHAQVRNALASRPVANAMGSTLLRATLDETLTSGVGPLPLRRLYAYYARGMWEERIDEAQVRADLAWFADHFDDWVACQEQAQQDARELFHTLRTNYPLPTVADSEAGRAEAMLKQARALRADPDHWANQPWMQPLMGRWTENLPDTVAAARQWLAERSAQQP